ncbi:glutamyl-tRNA reductase [Haloglomus irregulare]|uniref:Glutamyl-tRNA reductase n=1 Tax=Haloglomus irregulare TaxID=2234134 RepID=A0A554NCK7_9EURY|nr:glutamyl-tRNA reductase [Haloglomus irregulare]TSD15126.1 glutamyl-tRNA reductase [Haloglomus irregulare]
MTVPTGLVSGVSVSHEEAGLDHIERAAVESQHRGVETLLSQPGVREAFCLQTCNRVEAYVVTDDAETGMAALDRYTAGLEGVRREMTHEASLEHLIRVACGLESLVLGEDQIIGQVRRAFVTASEAGGIGPVMEDAITKAIHVGERARAETGINEGVVSLGSAAVRLARRELDDLAAEDALVVGAGEMGTLAARALAGEVASLTVANRTPERAARLADDIDATPTEAVGLDALEEAIGAAGLVLTTTGADEPIIGTGLLADAGETFVVDLASPRDVAAPATDLDSVTVRDLDALETVTNRTQEARAEAAERVERMVAEELDHLLSQYKRKRADQIIGAMYEGAERVKSREVEKAITTMETDGLSADQTAAVESMADALVNQLLSAPTKSIREAAETGDWTTINSALELFGPGMQVDPDEVAGEFLDDADPDEVDPDDIPPAMRERMPEAVLDRLATGSD